MTPKQFKKKAKRFLKLYKVLSNCKCDHHRCIHVHDFEDAVWDIPKLLEAVLPMLEDAAPVPAQASLQNLLDEVIAMKSALKKAVGKGLTFTRDQTDKLVSITQSDDEFRTLRCFWAAAPSHGNNK